MIVNGLAYFRRCCVVLLGMLLGNLVWLENVFAASRQENIWWMPEAVTTGGQRIDGLFNFLFLLTGGVFLAVVIVMIYFLIRYRHREGQRAIYSHGNDKLEIIWTTIPAIIFLGLVIWSKELWDDLHEVPPPGDALVVDVVAYQFGWDVRYAGVDGILGKTDDKLLSAQNKFGLIENDPAAKDDIILSDSQRDAMVVPVNTPIQLHLRSRDVIHAFYVPEFRLYQDAVPGKKISWTWFRPIKKGNFQLACSQLCGSIHYKMLRDLHVVSPEDFKKWMNEKNAPSAGLTRTSTDLNPTLARKE